MNNHIDWNKLWKASDNCNHENNDVEFWDNFAVRFKKKPLKDEYVEGFCAKCALEEGDTVFDMGCASGTLAIPLAKMGHEIYAADFSLKMLEVLMKDAAEEGVAELIHPIHLDWNEDWTKRDLPVCDVAISSRSLICDDLTEALKKLESVASKKVCLGVWETPAPNYDRTLAKYIGYERPGYGCYYYVINELLDRGVLPELSYLTMITPSGKRRSGSFEEVLNKARGSFVNGLTEEQEKLLDEYAALHIRQFEDEKGEYWSFDHNTDSVIAFISWKK